MTTQPDEIDKILVTFGQMMRRLSPENASAIKKEFREAHQAMATMIQIATTETLEWALDNSDDITNAIKDRIAEPSDPTEAGEK